jgi:hypothetical protein
VRIYTKEQETVAAFFRFLIRADTAAAFDLPIFIVHPKMRLSLNFAPNPKK